MFKKMILGFVLAVVSFGVAYAGEAGVTNEFEELVRYDYRDPESVIFRNYKVIKADDESYVTALYEIGYNKSKEYVKHIISRGLIRMMHDTVRDGGSLVIYEANGKNAYGGYVGFKRDCILVDAQGNSVRHRFINQNTCPWFHTLNGVVEQRVTN